MMDEIGIEFVQYTIGDAEQKEAAENRILALKLKQWRVTKMTSAASNDGKTCYVICLVEKD